MCRVFAKNRLLPTCAHRLMILALSPVQSLVANELFIYGCLKLPVLYQTSGVHYDSFHCRASVIRPTHTRWSTRETKPNYSNTINSARTYDINKYYLANRPIRITRACWVVMAWRRRAMCIIGLHAASPYCGVSRR